MYFFISVFIMFRPVLSFRTLSYDTHTERCFINQKMGRKILGRKVLKNIRVRGGDVSSLVMTLLHSVTVVHIMHLGSRSFSEHMALGAYYTTVDKHVDALVEAYQGMKGELITDYPLPPRLRDGVSVLEYMRHLRKEVSSRRKSFSGPELQNILDTITELIDSTIYKLMFLA